MPKISVVIITLNEEKNIERCLKSVIDVADEVMVVDSFSTDNTEEICKQYNVRFIQHKFEGYIEQKNWATNQATYDYCLSLDADEALSDNLKASVLKIKENWDADGYTFNRLTSFCGKWIKHTSWYPSRKLRLWDRRKGKWDGLNPHDKFIMVKGSHVKQLYGDLLHYSFYTISDQINQINRFSDILSVAYYQKGANSGLAHILVRPFWRFFRDFFIKLGFLDGFYGLVVSLNASFEVYLKYLKLKKLIEKDQKKAPFRICFLTSMYTQFSNEQWCLDNIKKLNQQGAESFILAHENSHIIAQAKTAKMQYITSRINNKTHQNLFKIFHLAAVLKRMRVQYIVVSNPTDALLASKCALFAGIKDISYLTQENEEPNTFLQKYVLKNYIHRFFTDQEIPLSLEPVIIKEKVNYLKAENNFTLNECLLSNKLKVLVSLDKINKPN